MTTRNAALLMASLFGVAAATGCQRPQRPVFPDVRPAVVWPPAPDQPRIRYVGQLVGEESLDRRPTGWAALKAVLEGPPPITNFSTPTAVAVDGDVVFVADGQARAVYRLNVATRDFAAITAAAGAAFGFPIDLALHSGRLYVADSARAAVFEFDAAGPCRRRLAIDGLKRPSGLAVNPRSGELYVLDAVAHACHVVGPGGALLRTIGGRGAGPAQFNYPAGLTFDPRRGLAIADAMNFRVQILAETGSPLHLFGQKGDAAGDFAMPRDVAFDSHGHVYVVDNQFENVQIFTPQGQLLMAWGQEGHGPGEFYLPSAITIDEKDRIWIADTYNRRVQVFEFIADHDATTSQPAP
jgi:DNA-binding beta-propeller fold protein YncE